MPIKTKGQHPPLFCVHGEPLKMAMRIKADRPVYGLSHVYHSSFQESVPDSIESLAREYLDDVYKVCPDGPFYLLGFSAGAMVAYEMARQVIASGKQVAYLVMIEPSIGLNESINTSKSDALRNYIDEVGWTPRTIAYLVYRAGKSIMSRTKTFLQRLRVNITLALGRELPEHLRWLGYLRALGPAIRAYKYGPLKCKATLIYRDLPADGRDMLEAMWHELLGAELDIHYAAGASGHNDFMLDPHLSNVGILLDRDLGVAR
jgi:thioesterase domain-containing protein